MAGITHFFDNEFAGSMHGLKKGGLTPLGREVVRRMEAKGMIVDVAHCSHACVADILKMASRPRSEEHTSELPSLMRISYAVFCLKKNKHKEANHSRSQQII